VSVKGREEISRCLGPGRGGIDGYSRMWQCELVEALGMGGRRTTKAKRQR
jgi:hypothetical protein